MDQATLELDLETQLKLQLQESLYLFDLIGTAQLQQQLQL
jgi:hypothetical protein